MAAQLHDRHLHRVAGAVGRLLEQQGDALARRAPAAGRLLGAGRAPRSARRATGRRRRAGALTRSTVARMATASSISSSVTRSDGASRSAESVHRVDHQPGVEGGRGRPRGVGRSRSSAASSRPRPRTASTAGDRLEALGEPRAGRGRRGRERPPRCITSSTARRRGGGQRLAAEGRGVVAGHEGGGHVVAGPAGADGHAVAERLRHGDDVGLDRRGAGSRTTRPVRPRPVCTSSTIEQARRARRTAAARPGK